MKIDYIIVSIIFCIAVTYLIFHIYNAIYKTHQTGSCTKCIDNKHLKKNPIRSDL